MPTWITLPLAVVTIVSFILSVISLYYAVRAVHDGQQLVSTMKVVNENGNVLAKRLESIGEAATRQSGALNQIIQSMSTRYQGQFPRYLPKVAELINHAEGELLMMWSVVAHGNFTSPPDWLKIKQALERARAKDRSIRLITYTDERRREQFLHQYPDFFTDWERAKYADNRPGELARNFLGSRHLDPKTVTRDEFVKLVDANDLSALGDVFPPDGVRRTKDTMNIYMWVADDAGHADHAEAVFALETHTERGVAQAFYTRDKQIIDSLKALFEKVWQESQADKPAAGGSVC